VATTSIKTDFITSEAGIRATEALNKMVMDRTYITVPSYCADSDKYADNLIPFVDKHLAYLRTHPATNPDQYLSNLRLMTRVKA
jgi:hypothetical protein